jgi:hypothetical protein
MLAAQNLVVPIANSFCRQLPLRNRGTPTRPSILLLRACDNRLSWFSFSISANQLRSVLCSQLADGLATPLFWGERVPFLAAIKNCTASSHQSGKFRSVQRLALLLISHPVAGAVGAGFGAGVHIHGLAGIGNS